MPQHAPSRHVRFGDFELDLRTRELRKGRRRLKVPEQSIQILEVLLEQPGDLVSREQLRARLWPSDTFVDFEHGMNAAVRRLRAALNDSAEAPRFIETLPRRGYRFIGSVRLELPSTARHEGGKAAADGGGTAGPDAEAAPLPAPAVPRVRGWARHAPVTFALVVLVAALAALARWLTIEPGTELRIRTLAVLPPLPLRDRTADNYFGLGLADTVIARLNQTGLIAVRPTSAIRRFAN